MRTRNIILPAGMLLFLAACSSSKNSATEANKKKTFNKIFIAAMTLDIPARVMLEKDLAALAVSKGYSVIKSIDVLPVSLDDPKLPSRAAIDSAMKANNCDGISLLYYSTNGSELQYTPGVQFNGTKPIIGSVIASVATRGKSNAGTPAKYESIDKPGHFTTTEKVYKITCTLFDPSADQAVYSVNSETFNDNELNVMSKLFMSELMKKWEKEKLIGK